MFNITSKLKSAIDDMIHHTDLFPWYYIGYGEKCNAWAVVEAIPLKEEDEYPEPGSQLEPATDLGKNWIGNNGVEMIVMNTIMDMEAINALDICKFVAMVHAELLKDHLFS